MKKIFFSLMCLIASTGIYAQQITGTRVVEVLGSDDFESTTAWSNFDTPDLNLSLNNALGGNGVWSWSDGWAGACVHEGKSAGPGQNCMQIHWGGGVPLVGFEIEPDKIYQLEVMVHPGGGVPEDGWNQWSAVHLFSFESSEIWQEQGVRIRIMNGNPAGKNPYRLHVDYWVGEDGSALGNEIFDASSAPQNYTINDAKDETATNYWFPLKVIFKGEGTTADPLIIDYYLNDIFVGTSTFDDIVWKGDNMIALQKMGNDDDLGKFDDIKITLLEYDETSVNETAAYALNAYLQGNMLNISSAMCGDDVTYELFSVTGAVMLQGTMLTNNVAVALDNIPAGIYVLKVKDTQTGVIKTTKIIKN